MWVFFLVKLVRSQLKWWWENSTAETRPSRPVSETWETVVPEAALG